MSMRSFLSKSKNEPIELTIGILLNVIGGILIGFTFEESSYLIPAIVFTLIGIWLEIRVLNTHIIELRKLKNDLKEATNESKKTIQEMGKQKGEIEKSKQDLDHMKKEIKAQINTLKTTREEIFSKNITNQSSPTIQDALDKLNNRITRIEGKAGLGSSTWRRGGTRY